MWQDIFFQVEKRFDLLLKGSWYRMDYIKMRTWNQYTKKGFNMLMSLSNWWPVPKGEIIGFLGVETPFSQEETLRRWYQDRKDRNLLNDMELHAWMSSTALEPFQIPVLDYTCMFWRSYRCISYKAYSNSPDLVVTTPLVIQIYFLIQLFSLFFFFLFCFVFLCQRS